MTTREILADIRNVRDDLERFKDDPESVAELTEELRELEHALAVERGTADADAPGFNADEGIHS